MLNDLGRSVRGSKILIYGLSYKANTGDARETPSIPIALGLLALGADVQAADPHVPDSQFPTGVTRSSGDAGAMADADVIVYLVNHAEFDAQAIEGSGTPVLDCQHALHGEGIVVL
jgi:UDP-N-acetyl-D-mannosaminuronate dehydrogenase